MKKIFDVIIIGAGISGISASLSLSKNRIEHIILEARDRIGGRIFTKNLDGASIHVGASFVHSPHKNNTIAKLMQDMKWEAIPTCLSSLQYLYQGKGEIKEQITKAAKLSEELNQSIYEVVKDSEDMSFAQASQPFYQNFKEDQEQLSIVKWKQRLVTMAQGGKINELSAKNYIFGEEDISECDVMPKGGYAKLLSEICNICKTEVLLNQYVTKIDYSQSIVAIYTKSGVYYAKKVISSLPLGLLQKELVQFHPPLPKSHHKALQSIGNGVFNKLILTFEQPFWDQSKEWIGFIAQGQSRYTHAFVVRESSKPMICVFISKQTSMQLDALSDEEIVKDFMIFLSKFILKTEIKLRAYEVTRWHLDPFSLGSYSFFKVGTTSQDFEILRSSIGNRLWFIGEHCNPINGCTHSAFETGLWAAEQVQKSLQL